MTCMLCVDSIQLGPGVAAPLDLFVLRTGAQASDLDWTAHAGGTAEGHIDASGGQVVQTWVYDVVIDVPVDHLIAQPSIQAGPEGCRLQMTDGGFILMEGDARVVSTGA
jgi:hypothetical protein